MQMSELDEENSRERGEVYIEIIPCLHDSLWFGETTRIILDTDQIRTYAALRGLKDASSPHSPSLETWKV